MNSNHNSISRLSCLVVTAVTLSVGLGFAQTPKAVPANPRTATTAQAKAASRCTTMRCTTNADRVAAAKRAAALRPTAPVARKMNTAVQSFGRLAVTATTSSTSLPVQPGCSAPVMNPGGVPDYMSGCVGNYANSPLPVDNGTGTMTGGIRKFIDPLPTIPTAVPDKHRYPGSDYYEIELIETSQKMHTDLPPTTLRLYHQTNPGMDVNGGNVIQPPAAQSLGPLIIAQKGVPVRIKFTNRLPAGGSLSIPVDTTVMGAGMGPDGALYSQNRANIHLHGGNTPWISDGTPHQWTAPVGESTGVHKGVSTQDVPGMPTGDGEMTFYYTNDQSARLMFYHDHSYGITRLNVYSGVAAGYLLQDAVELALTNGGTIVPPGALAPVVIPAGGIIPGAANQLALVIQDKTFIPPADQLAAQDPTWNWGPSSGTGAAKTFSVGNLWFPHVYMTNQNPSDDSGANAMGRWDWGAWFWPVMDTSTLVPGAQEWACPTTANPGQMCPGLPNPSLVPESFLDTPVVNGAAYPVLQVNPQAYRLRILNASNDRFLNLTLYQATDGTGALCNTTGLPTGTGVASCTEVRQITSTLDGTAASQGPIPDPATKGPQMIQIGNEAGFIANPIVLDNQPITYKYNRRDIVVLNVDQKNLWLGPAERGDVIVDFSAFAGKTLILYNDSGAPVPAFDTRYDYYTGDMDQTATGGAPSTLPGYGPNTRTIMQIQVAASGAGVPFDAAALTAALPAAFAASQPAPIIPEAAYATAFPSYSKTINSYGRIQDTSMFTGSLTGVSVNTPGSGYTVAPTVTVGRPSTGGTQATATATITGGIVTGFTVTNPGAGYYSTPLITLAGGGGTGASGYAVGLPMLRKTIQELFELDYGRMNATLGTELPFTNFANQTTVPLGFIDPPTETFADGVPQIWKITHNGVDTHAIHFHLFNVQVINRVGWDGAVRAPEADEIGWKETVKMSPLEDVIVAFLPVKQTLPFPLPDSIRPEDPTSPLGASIRVGDINGGAAVNIPNSNINYGQEYVWHCHLLGHEENDMMRPMIFQVAPEVPSTPVPVLSGSAVTVSWTDLSASATTFNLQRATDSGFTQNVVSLSSVVSTSGFKSMESYVDSSIPGAGTYFYKVQAVNAGAFKPLAVAPFFQNNGVLLSAWSGAGQVIVAPIAGISPGTLIFQTQPLGLGAPSQTVTLSNTGNVALTINSITLTGNTPANFSQVNICGGSLAAGSTCTISIGFKPVVAGPVVAGLSISSNDPVNPTLSVALNGSGLATVTVSRTSVGLGIQLVGRSSAPIATTVIGNYTGSALTINSITAPAGVVVNNSCPASLGQARQCTFSLTFAPTVAGQVNGNVVISTSFGTYNLAVSGAAALPSLYVSRTSLAALGTQVVGTSSAPMATTIIGNFTGAAVTINSITGPAGIVVNTSCPASLANGAQCSFALVFAPTVAGPVNGNVVIASSTGNSGFAVTGTAVASAVLVSRTSAAFGVLPINTVSPAVGTTIITNQTGAALSMNSIAGPAWAVVNNACPASLSNLQACTFSLSFAPTAVGPVSGKVVISTSFGNYNLAVTGTGK